MVGERLIPPMSPAPNVEGVPPVPVVWAPSELVCPDRVRSSGFGSSRRGGAGGSGSRYSWLRAAMVVLRANAVWYSAALGHRLLSVKMKRMYNVKPPAVA